MNQDNPTARNLVGVVLDGSYRIDDLLGEGGMGAVYSATQLRLDKRVAIKVMARGLAANPEALERFRREARVTSGLGHPHIVQVFDFSTTPAGEPFFVLEFLEGEDLDHRLRRVGRLPLAEVVHIVKQVASALSATHAKDIVHRDLKPGNIYLLEVAGEHDFVKVLDFGISKVRTSSTKLTRTSSIMGTPNYMSPEQAMGKTDEIDERTDLWALACIAWECLSGVCPFMGENVPSILFQIVHEAPGPLLPQVPGLAPQVEQVLRRALAKNKQDRFTGVVEFVTALEAAASGAGLAVQAATGVTGLGSPTMIPPGLAGQATTFSLTAGALEDSPDLPRATPKRWPWAVGAGGIALVLAILWFRPSPTKGPMPSPPVPVAAPVLAVPVAALPPDAGHEDRRLEIPAPPPRAPVNLAPEETRGTTPTPRAAKKRATSKKAEEDQEIWH